MSRYWKFIKAKGGINRHERKTPERIDEEILANCDKSLQKEDYVNPIATSSPKAEETRGECTPEVKVSKFSQNHDFSQASLHKSNGPSGVGECRISGLTESFNKINERLSQLKTFTSPSEMSNVIAEYQPCQP